MFLIDKKYLIVKKTARRGRGVFANRKIKEGTIVGDYTGKLLRLEEVDFEKERKNLYLMYYNNNTAVYPDPSEEGVHLINHSCTPNCWIKKYKKHTLVFTLKNIKKSEELTINYLLPPKKGCNNCTHDCFCKSINCTGTMHLTEKKYEIWQTFQKKDEKIITKPAKGKYLKPLSKYPKKVPAEYICKIKKLGLLN